MNTIDIQKLNQLYSLYLKQRYTDAQDIELLGRWERGESVIKLSREYHRSVSSIYRLRERVSAFLNDPPEDQDDIYTKLITGWVDIPMPLLPCAMECDSEDAFLLFRFSIGLYLNGKSYFPRWFLAQISSSLGRKRYAESIVEKMARLGFDTGLLYRVQIYNSIFYEKGIHFEFTDITRAIIDSYPPALLVRDVEEQKRFWGKGE